MGVAVGTDRPRGHPCALWPGLWGTHSCSEAGTFHTVALSLPGYLLFRDFAFNQAEEAKPLMEFYEEVRWGDPSGRNPMFMRRVGGRIWYLKGLQTWYQELAEYSRATVPRGLGGDALGTQGT